MTNKKSGMFKYAEKCLYDYNRNIACLEILQDDLQLESSGLDVHAQNYQSTFTFTGTPSNPVEARVLRIEQLEKHIKQLERRIKPVSRLIYDLKAPYVYEGSLKAELLRLMELYYFGQNSLALIMAKLSVSKQCVYNWRRLLVKMLVGYMGG